MSADFQKLREIFLSALEQSPDEREAYVDQLCAGDQQLHRQVAVMLKAHDASQGPLDRGPLPEQQTGTYRQASEESGMVIGHYKLLEEIGAGGMGTVWMAQQTEPVRRLVALKLIKAGMDSKAVIARFEAERQALALMDHPNIARVIDGGTTDAGRPYFVMDLVAGVPITCYCDEHHLTPRQRLELFIPICQAVQHAHQKGIIHRDLKPSNVLVALYDGKPVPKIIDFGVAKAKGTQLTDATLVTGFGAVVGTLEYMSPEQAEINQFDIDTRSDVYSLGVLLYELLTGSPPFSRKEIEKVGMLEMLRVIREQEPSKPSTKLSTAEGLPTLAANRGTEPAKLTKLVRGELDWIVLKALEKDRNRRYETASGFAMDVQRYLADEPVLACPPSVSYRLLKFARRNKGPMAMAGVGLLFLMLLGSGVGWAVRDRVNQRAEFERERSAQLAKVQREKSERQRRLAAHVELILDEVNRLESEQKWFEALAAAQRAAAIADHDVDSETAGRVRRRLRDLQFINQLDQIRMNRATLVEGRWDLSGADRDYARAFLDYGVNVQELAVETSIDLLKARPALAVPLAAALDDWANARRAESSTDADGWNRLVAVARAIDPDVQRARLRASWGRPNAEVRDELSRLAKSIDIRTQPAATVFHLARTLRQVNESNAAIQLVTDARYVHPSDFWLNFELGVLLYERQDFEAAIRFFTAAVSIRPNSATAHNNLGLALMQQKKLVEAIRCLRTASEIDPKYSSALSNLGRVLMAHGELNEGHECLRKAIEFDRTNALSHCNLGDALKAQGKPYKAIEAYEEARRLNPNDLWAHFGLAAALAQSKQWDRSATVYAEGLQRFELLWPGPWYEAIGSDELFTRLRALLPNDPRPWIMRARLHVLQRDWERAVADYQQAIALGELIDESTYACLLLLLGDNRGYEQFCLKVRGHRALAVSAIAGFPTAEIVERAREDAEANPNPWRLYELSVAHYRNGEFELAIQRAEQSNAGFWRGDAKALNWLVLAMAHHRLGHAAVARQSLEQALAISDRGHTEPSLAGIRWPDMAPPDVVEFEVLRREAEEMINSKPKPTTDKK